MAGVRHFFIFLGLFMAYFLTEQEVLSAKALAGNNADPGFSDANFVEHLFHYLNASQVGSRLVNQIEDCVIACLHIATCFSFNLAANRDIEGRLLCEILASDKYNSSDKFQANPSFHHFSIYNPCSQRPCMNGGTCIALYFRDDYSCICPPDLKGKNCAIRFGCSFDTDNCGFIQSEDDTFDWTRRSGGTPSSYTGPSADHSGKGSYMYIETSSTRLGDNARLSKTISLNGSSCLSFNYHMFGANMGSLKVMVGGKKLFSKSGNQGNRWILFQAPLSGSGNKLLEFEGVAGSGYYGDAAIDEVNVYDC